MRSRIDSPRASGFSLLELMIAMVVTLGVVTIVFQLFIQNEKVFRDETLITEMQQSTRAVAAMMADEIRMAGQGVPVYAARYDFDATEATQGILDGSSSSTLRFRAGTRNGLAVVTDTPPLTYAVGTAATIGIDDGTDISSITGGGTGRHLYLWGKMDNGGWTWVRAEILAFSVSLDAVLVMPKHISGAGGTFAETPNVSLEEGISYRLDSGNILRGTTTDFTSLTSPTLSESAVGENFTNLAFTYYDGDGTAISPTTLALRASVRRIDFVLEAETSEPLSTGASRSYAVSMSVNPRNLEIP